MNCSMPYCTNPREGNTEMCATHNYEKRKTDREAKKVKVVRQPKKVSEKHADELLKYTKLKKQYLEFKMMCEAQLEGCTKSAIEIHHCSKSAANFLNTYTWIGICRSCHTKIEAMPSDYRRSIGLLTD